MLIISSVDIAIVKNHERRTGSNATVGGYGMDQHCPTAEIEAFQVTLEADDWAKIFLIAQFAKFTIGNTCKVHDIDWHRLGDDSKARINSFIEPPANSRFTPVDLHSSADLALVIVSANAESGSLVVIDGNHRAIAQWHKYGAVSGVHAFLCVHKNINNWAYVPPQARNFQS